MADEADEDAVNILPVLVMVVAAGATNCSRREIRYLVDRYKEGLASGDALTQEEVNKFLMGGLGGAARN